MLKKKKVSKSKTIKTTLKRTTLSRHKRQRILPPGYIKRHYSKVNAKILTPDDLDKIEEKYKSRIEEAYKSRL